MNANKSRQIGYEVVMHQIGFSGRHSAPMVWATCKGKGAKRRALAEALLQLHSSCSVTGMTVVQRGGAGDGRIVAEHRNADAYMCAGEHYTAAIVVEPNGRIVALRATSRDSRVRSTDPVVYTPEVLSSEWRAAAVRATALEAAAALGGVLGDPAPMALAAAG